MEQADVPGVVLYVKEHSENPCHGKFKASGVVILTSEISDLEVWDKVVEKLDGMPVYTVRSITEGLVDAARKRAKRAEERSIQTMEEARQEVDRMDADLSFSQAEAQRLTGENQQMGARIKELLEMVEVQDATIAALESSGQ